MGLLCTSLFKTKIKKGNKCSFTAANKNYCLVCIYACSNSDSILISLSTSCNLYSFSATP
jgi:hypothetical protein